MRMKKNSMEGGKEENQVGEGELLSASTPLNIEILRKETFLNPKEGNTVAQLKERHKIVFKNEDKRSIGTNNKLNTFNDNLSHSESGYGKVTRCNKLRPFVFVFIDDLIDCLTQGRLNRKARPVLLGDRRYKVKKLFYDCEITVFELLRSLMGFTFNVSHFMKMYKVSQVCGFVIHPLAKVADLTNRDNHLIISKRENSELGFDKSLRKGRRIFGLDNLGNTCFMNSALQCIMACTEFSDFLMVINRTLFDITKMPLTKAMTYIVQAGEREMQSVAPLAIKQALGDKRSMYLEIKEQDAVEFINDLFDVIHEEIVNGSDKEYLKFYNSKGLCYSQQKGKASQTRCLEDQIETHLVVNKEEIGDNKCSKLKSLSEHINSIEPLTTPDLDYHRWLNSNRSIITDLFFSKMKSSIVCTACKASRDVYEPNLIHSLPVPGAGFYNENIVLFYESPEKVPLRIFARAEMSIEELKNCLYMDYDFHHDIAFVQKDSYGNMREVPIHTLLSTLVDTLYCYEYQQKAIGKYYWITIVVKSLWLSYNFDFNFLVRLNSLTEGNIYDVLRCRLTPFLMNDAVFFFYENIEQFFTFSIEDKFKEPPTVGPLDSPLIRLELSNYNYKRLFGKGYSPTQGIIQLLSRPVTLLECLNLFLEKEFIFGHEKKLCEACGNHSIFYKKLDFVDFPKYLIIQLKRFKFNGKVFEKIDTLVDFPLDFIVIQGIKYRIIAISNHITSSSLKNIGSNGHYTAYVKRDVWYYCNDQNVGPVSEGIDKKNAYIFFLERCT